LLDYNRLAHTFFPKQDHPHCMRCVTRDRCHKGGRSLLVGWRVAAASRTWIHWRAKLDTWPRNPLPDQKRLRQQGCSLSELRQDSIWSDNAEWHSLRLGQGGTREAQSRWLLAVLYTLCTLWTKADRPFELWTKSHDGDRQIQAALWLGWRESGLPWLRRQSEKNGPRNSSILRRQTHHRCHLWWLLHCSYSRSWWRRIDN